MNKKLLLINPINPNRAGLATSRFTRWQPLGLAMVAALTPDDWEIEIIDENWKPFEYKS